MNVAPAQFTWNRVPRPKSLSQWQFAPDEPGFYELGFFRKGHFYPKYGGRASDLTLRKRLRQHFEHSHNASVRQASSRLWYRCRALPSAVFARFVEAHYLAAYEYEWNKRQEWREHWALPSST